MEYLKAWLFAQKKLIEKNKPVQDKILVKYLDDFVKNIEEKLEEGEFKKDSNGKFISANNVHLQSIINVQRDIISIILKEHDHFLNPEKNKDISIALETEKELESEFGIHWRNFCKKQ